MISVLCIGDVIGTVGMKYLHRHLPALKKLKKIDAVIVNGENSADTNGITPDSANYLLNCGVDLITTGNHSFQRKESYSIYESENIPVIRPANYPSKAPGRGTGLIDIGRARIRVVNMMGTVGMNPVLDCPFATSDALLDGIEEKIVIMDLHAEATAEKRALACYLDGRVSAVFGTHTHVQTADEQMLPGGTGFITDVGMTGPVNSVIGVSIDAAIEKMKTKMPVRLNYADGKCMLNAVIFAIDEKSGKTMDVERINISN